MSSASLHFTSYEQACSTLSRTQLRSDLLTALYVGVGVSLLVLCGVIAWDADQFHKAMGVPTAPIVAAAGVWLVGGLLLLRRQHRKVQVCMRRFNDYLDTGHQPYQPAPHTPRTPATTPTPEVQCFEVPTPTPAPVRVSSAARPHPWSSRAGARQSARPLRPISLFGAYQN